MFKERQIAIATKHQKERVISPLLIHHLGVECIVPENLDTDLLGTFTGEVNRIDNAYLTARKKCYMAMEITHANMAIASEGSFGMHPTLFFIPADEELVLFIDKKNNLEIFAREISTTTNFSSALIKSEEELWAFANQALFPSHGLIMKKNKEEKIEIFKGITQPYQLKTTFDYFIKKYQEVYLETDMRAMYNPTRMKVIEKATLKLVEKINSLCPKCQTPGFGITNAQPGLPCERCYHPTRSTLSHIYSCLKCTYTKVLKYPNGKTSEEPTYCDVCNP